MAIQGSDLQGEGNFKGEFKEKFDSQLYGKFKGNSKGEYKGNFHLGKVLVGAGKGQGKFRG